MPILSWYSPRSDYHIHEQPPSHNGPPTTYIAGLGSGCLELTPKSDPSNSHLTQVQMAKQISPHQTLTVPSITTDSRTKNKPGKCVNVTLKTRVPVEHRDSKCPGLFPSIARFYREGSLPIRFRFVPSQLVPSNLVIGLQNHLYPVAIGKPTWSKCVQRSL